jgi:hypothetical protein
MKTEHELLSELPDCLVHILAFGVATPLRPGLPCCAFHLAGVLCPLFPGGATWLPWVSEARVLTCTR